MAPERDHLRQARHNTALAQELAQDLVYKDWVLTITFYAALHFVEAFFAKKKWHSDIERDDETSAHSLRRMRLRDETKLFRSYNIYRLMENNSRQARYLELWQQEGGNAVAASYFRDEDVRVLLEDDLETLIQELGYAEAN